MACVLRGINFLYKATLSKGVIIGSSEIASSHRRYVYMAREGQWYLGLQDIHIIENPNRCLYFNSQEIIISQSMS